MNTHFSSPGEAEDTSGNATKVVLTRHKLYPVVARPGPAWRWTYSYQVDNAPPLGYGTGLRSLREMVKRRYPGAVIHEAWKSAP